MCSKLFTRFTCRNALSIDIEERIPWISETKNLRYLVIERQYVDIQPIGQSFQIDIRNSDALGLHIY